MAATMSIDTATAAQLVDVCAAAIVVLGIVLSGTFSLGRLIWLVAVQSIFIGIAALGVGVATGAGHLLFGGLMAIAIKGLVVPYILGTVLRRSSVRRERKPILGRRASVLAAVAIVFVAVTAADGSFGTSSLGATRALPVAIAEVLTGLLLLMTRRKALALVVGLLVFENGIALTAFSLTYGMPFVVELGVLFDLLIVIVVAWVYTRRMLEVIGTTSTDRMRSLRG